MTDGAARGLPEIATLGHRDLRRDEVDVEDLLGHGVLDLQAGVHLQEERTLLAAAVVRVVRHARDQELDGAGSDVVDGLGRVPRCRVQRVAGRVGQVRRGRLLDDLLVPPLDRAVAVAEDPDRAVGVGHDLHLDVTRGRQVRLDEHGAVAEGGLGLRARHRELALEVLGLLDDAHATPATTGGGLDQEREVARRGGGRVDLEDRHVSSGHELLGADLAAHRLDRLRRRTDPRQARLTDGARELGVLGQEAVARVDRVGPGRLGGGEHEVTTQVGLGCRVAGQVHRDVGLANEGRLGIGVGVDRDGADAEVTARAEHAPGDLAAVRDQDAANHEGTPWVGVARAVEVLRAGTRRSRRCP